MRVKKMAEKSKEKYRFILKSGEGYKNCIYRLFSQIWKEEVKPQQWRNTVIIQLYKGKGETFDFNCQRNIHTKEDTPKLFEGILVDKSKQKLVDKCSKYQIGGIPGHRSQEHLFTVKSVISLYSLLNIPVILQLFDISKYFDKEILKDAMDTLFTYGIKGKLYRLWYELYRDAQIRVKTGAGMTSVEATGENVAQGSIGGAILSSCSLDKTVTNYFSGSSDELSYATTRLQPIMFQDDTIRLVTSIEAAQRGNIIMNAAMKRKQLELNTDKCCVLIFDTKLKRKSTREAINLNCLLTIGGNKIKAKQQDKYLGDILNEGGLKASVQATINERYGKSYSTIREIGAVINDFRINAIGGLRAGLDIFEMVVVPSLLNNSDTWIDIDNGSITRLDDLQNWMFKNLLAVPHSVPTPALRSELGCLSMQERIDSRKLNFLFHLKTLENSSLAREVYELQKKYGHPGLVSECRKLISKYDLPDIIEGVSVSSKLQWKNIVKNKIREYSEEKLKNEFGDYSKLKGGPLMEDGLKVQPYIQNLKLSEARTMFRIRTLMMPAKMNMKNNRKFAEQLWKCDQCQRMDAQSHILWCPFFAPLREGKNIEDDKDLVDYFQKVFKIREDLESNQEGNT